MGLDRIGRLILFAAALASIAAFQCISHAQQPPPAGSSQPSGPGNNQQGTVNTTQQTALEDPLLDEEDEERNITYMKSHVDFEYRHDDFDGGSSGDSYWVRWQQSFAPSQRLAAGIELPFLHQSGQTGASTARASSANGVGDIKLDLRGMIRKGEKFETAAGIQVTVPSASNDEIGQGQTILRLAWGCSAQVTKRTLLSGEFGYNKAVHNQRSSTGTNSLEPEAIFSRAFRKRFGGYLDWDNYYDFAVSKYFSTLESGLEIALDRRERWALSPYVLFPLNHAGTEYATKRAVGFLLSFTY